MTKIAIIDYGMGNLRSVQKGFEHAGVASVAITRDPAELTDAQGLVLPGVGAFRDAIACLRESGLAEALTAAVTAGIPLLGICLGMQLLLEVSYENGEHEGLGLVPGECHRFDGRRREGGGVRPLKIPHIGWNTLTYCEGSALMKNLPQESYFYFVHSYHCVLRDDADVLGRTDYGGSFVSALQHDNVYATQFHPEKSSTRGLQLLKNFAHICEVSTQ